MKFGFLKVFEVLVLISLCIGFMGISVIGSIIFPKVNKVAWPVVCGGGTVQIARQEYYNRGTNIDTQIYCVNNSTGTKTDITYPSDFVGGAYYTITILVPLLVLYGVIHMINRSKNPST